MKLKKLLTITFILFASCSMLWAQSDVTTKITNPSFEISGMSGWEQLNMQTQGNTVFDIKAGNTYIEKWTGRGARVGDAYVKQTVKNLPLGAYRLTVAAQNIQEDSPKSSQTGAYIFAGENKTSVDLRQNYSVDFICTSGETTLGFMAQNASGNWISVDNFKLFYISDDFDVIKTAVQKTIDIATELESHQMNADNLKTLKDAIAATTPLLSQIDANGYAPIVKALETAIAAARLSVTSYENLKVALDEAHTIISNGKIDSTTYQSVIDKATTIYNDITSSNKTLSDAVIDLGKAAFCFRVANGFGTIPTVTTDTRFARGATQAFGRSTVVTNGASIIERGFCWSENPDPKVTDNRTVEYFNNNGAIYVMRNMKPATKYYVRAYAMTKDYAVGYGVALKVITLPKGQVGWWYNNGGDADANARINYAINTAVNTYWNNLTNIIGFGTSVSYGSGTPTADSSYGGSMRIGPNSAYQQTGTVMHEMLHGIGVGTLGWWNGSTPLRENGLWTGDRVTNLLRFWDNSTTEKLQGDGMHMWPYGINGAQEDNHSDALYTITSLLAQALGEDGLPCSDSRGYASPAYNFDQEDTIKYYIKSESPNCGLVNSYLVENDNHQLVWKQMTADEATADSKAAWYVTFTPNNQYYQLHNAATGYYMTYTKTGLNGISTANRPTLTANENFHLMCSRVDVDLNGKKGVRGYWIIHPESSGSPATLTANTNNTTSTTGLNLWNTATNQRWIILSGDEAKNLETSLLVISKNKLTDMVAKIRRTAATPHKEDVSGADNTLETSLAGIETQGAAAINASEISVLINQARSAGMTFLKDVTPQSIDAPFDLTFLINNPSFDTNSKDGWTSSLDPNYYSKIDEFYETTFNFYQDITNVPKGTYQLRVQAFQRPGETNTVYTDFKAGKNNVSSAIFIGTTTKNIKNIMEDRQTNILYSGDGSDLKVGDGAYVPNSMEGTTRYFAKNLYDNNVSCALTADASNLRIGISSTKSDSYYWTIFDNFRLYYYGSIPTETVTAINEVVTSDNNHVRRFSNQVYTITGVKVGTSIDKLPAGIYIQNNKKMIVK